MPPPAEPARADAALEPSARVIAVQDGVASIRAEPGVAVAKNAAALLLPSRPGPDGRQERLLAEVLRVRGSEADLQVFESTAGVAVGDPVVLTGRPLSVRLGPGLLGSLFDGLQRPLEALAAAHGTFLPRGAEAPPLDPAARWAFAPAVRSGDRVKAGDVLGTVEERHIRHRIMAPFDLDGCWTVLWIEAGVAGVLDVVAELGGPGGARRPVRLAQDWPIRTPLPAGLLAAGRAERLRPDRPLVTTLRIIDTLFPVALGGTAAIPGPFGAGKTVLQGLIARYSEVDVVVSVACGERAGEVVEMIRDFARMEDPRHGGALLDRTVIVCNTSSMPVAAREASIYTGVTIGEYYRQMGLDVLLIADSTSRWAQALRETSGRLEEIPGEEGYPAYLDSTIRALYDRAGVIRTADGRRGSLTIIGAVSPAGGDFDEPVTRSTLAAVRTFLGLSADRAYKRFYPAIDPLISWSRLEERLLAHWARAGAPALAAQVQTLKRLLREGEDIARLMRVTGEEGITLADFVRLEKARFADAVFLQQDAFDPVDVSAPPARQQALLALVIAVVERPLALGDKDEVRRLFQRLTAIGRNLNYAPDGSPDRARLEAELRAELDRASTPGGGAPAGEGILPSDAEVRRSRHT